jgi:hypothetical protein
MRKLKRWVWPTIAVTLSVGWLWTATLNQGLREQVALLKSVAGIQARWCEGLGQVNTLCEETISDLATRLGLDQEFLPLVTTSLWRRTMPISVNKAKRMLQAGAKDDPKAALGGGDDEPPKRGKRGR